MNKQEIGETRDAIIEDDNKQLQDIIHANKHKVDPYWVVLYVKNAKSTLDGRPTLVKCFKPYGIKPQSQVGMIVGEVDNSKGTIEWEVNMPDVPFDYDALGVFGVEPANEGVVETTTIGKSYMGT